MNYLFSGVGGDGGGGCCGGGAVGGGGPLVGATGQPLFLSSSNIFCASVLFVYLIETLLPKFVIQNGLRRTLLR